MEEIKFTEGLIVKRAESAPEFVIGNLSVKVDEFTKWLTENQSNGWVNIALKVSKNKKPYACLDTWKPSGEAPAKQEDDMPY